LEYWLQERGRYLCLNVSEWWQHGRAEVRLHHGTLRYSDILTWVTMLLTLVDAVKQLNDHMDMPRLETAIGTSAIHDEFRAFIVEYASVHLYDELRNLVARRHPESLNLWPDAVPEFTAR
jgi:hypothetical protein